MLPSPNDRERQVATAIHVAGIFAPLWLPIVAYFIARPKSEFVAAHALQEVIDGIVWKALLLLTMIGGLAWSIVRLVHHFQTDFKEFSWQEVAWRVVFSVTLFSILFIWNLVQALIQANRAWKGQWTRRAVRAYEKALKSA